MKAKIYIPIFYIITVLCAFSCIEEIAIETKTFENALVIEATITNEFKYQEINLSRTFKLELNGPSPERNAIIKITDNSQNTYKFTETIPGKYVSDIEFSPQLNVNYVLQITTFDGRSYSSQPTILTSSTQIDTINTLREIDDFGNENITISVDSFDPTGNSKYYRYKYEETYKIIAPYWSKYDLILTTYVYPFRVGRVNKTDEKQVCYNTVPSNSIIQTETTGFFEDRVSNFPVRVISRYNPIISHRYSILVKQYIQSLDAFTFYKTLANLSGSESLFSQNQPGFFNGNVFSIDDANEKVIGFFEISSVSSKRIYFNYTNLFPNEPLPPYFTECDFFAPTDIADASDPSALYTYIKGGDVIYYSENLDPDLINPGPYFLVTAECGDCTRLGTNVKPNFWID